MSRQNIANLCDSIGQISLLSLMTFYMTRFSFDVCVDLKQLTFTAAEINKVLTTIITQRFVYNLQMLRQVTAS